MVVSTVTNNSLYHAFHIPALNIMAFDSRGFNLYDQSGDYGYDQYSSRFQNGGYRSQYNGDGLVAYRSSGRQWPDRGYSYQYPSNQYYGSDYSYGYNPDYSYGYGYDRPRRDNNYACRQRAQQYGLSRSAARDVCSLRR